MNLSTKQKQTHSNAEQICVCQGGGKGSGMAWEFGVMQTIIFRMDKQ